MPQGVLPYKYEEEKNDTGMTALTGLPVYLDLAQAIDLPDSIGRHMQVSGSQGWTDGPMGTKMTSRSYSA